MMVGGRISARPFQSLGLPVPSVGSVHGSSVRPMHAVGIAGAGSRFFTQQVTYSRVVTATD